MTKDPLAVIREVHASLSAWLEEARKLPDPSAQPPDTVQRISAQIELVNIALREATPAVAKTAEWKKTVEAYSKTLHELRARLSNFEITLRIRQNQMRNTSAQIGIARSWSDLAKHIG